MLSFVVDARGQITRHRAEVQHHKQISYRDRHTGRARRTYRQNKSKQGYSRPEASIGQDCGPKTGIHTGPCFNLSCQSVYSGARASWVPLHKYHRVRLFSSIQDATSISPEKCCEDDISGFVWGAPGLTAYLSTYAERKRYLGIAT
jgi:hypothetical protein